MTLFVSSFRLDFVIVVLMVGNFGDVEIEHSIEDV